MFSIMCFIISFMTWVVLSGQFDLFHLSLGVISCVLVTAISKDLLFEEKGKGPFSRLAEGFRFIYYCLWLLYQIAVANIHVIGLALSTKQMTEHLDPHIFTFKTSLKSTFARFVLANSITLTPGTVTIRIDGDTFYIHAISQTAAGDLEKHEATSEMERRVAWVFEGDQSS